MPAHGAPPSTWAETVELRGELHGRIAAMVERGVRDGSVRADLTMRDLITFGSMIAVPQSNTANWAELMSRQVDLFIDAVCAARPEDGS